MIGDLGQKKAGVDNCRCGSPELSAARCCLGCREVVRLKHEGPNQSPRQRREGTLDQAGMDQTHNPAGYALGHG